MKLNKYVSEIRKFLSELTKKKTDKERLLLLSKIRLQVELMQGPIKKQLDKETAAYAAKTRIIKKALKQFLTALDRIYTKHEEIGDSDVRDQMYKAIYRSFIQPQRGYSLPSKFGMFSNSGDNLVRAALQSFLTHPEVLAASQVLKTAEDRFAAFQDDGVKTAKGTVLFEYFGYSNKPLAA